MCPLERKFIYLELTDGNHYNLLTFKNENEGCVARNKEIRLQVYNSINGGESIRDE